MRLHGLRALEVSRDMKSIAILGESLRCRLTHRCSIISLPAIFISFISYFLSIASVQRS